MTHHRRSILLNALKLFDVLVALACVFFAALLVLPEAAGSPGRLLSMTATVSDFLVLLAFLILWHFTFVAFGLYQSRRLSPRRAEVVDLVRAASAGSLLLVLGGLLLGRRGVTPSFVVGFWLSAILILVGSRAVLRYSLARIRLRGRNLRSLVIVGANERTIQFARRIEARPELGYYLIGFVDDDWPGLGELERTGLARVAGLADFPAYLREQVVDEVVIGLPMKSFYQQASGIAAKCQEMGVIVRVLYDIFNVKPPASRADRFEDDLVVTLSERSIDGLPAMAKRALDVVVSLVLLPVLTPLLGGVALLIKATSPGPVFFVQERVGRSKRTFRLYKFRTMVDGAERALADLEHLNEVSGPVFKIKDDPRVTPLGRFLRRTSIDELPQLFNVLRGDMSLVGPRPVPIRDYNGFEADWHRRRFSVRPGITCLWQVNGRSAIPFDRWMELDMQYIDQWSLLLDLRILVKTIPAVLKGSGAA